MVVYAWLITVAERRRLYTVQTPQPQTYFERTILSNWKIYTSPFLSHWLRGDYTGRPTIISQPSVVDWTIIVL